MPKLLRAAVVDRLYYLLLRDFCESMSQISNQFRRYRLTSDICWPILEDLLGRQRNRGPLWQMKDTAHHLSRYHSAQDGNAFTHPAAFLDLAIGAIFHETVRLKEIAYMGAVYLPAAHAWLSNCEIDAPEKKPKADIVLNSGKRILPILEAAFSSLPDIMRNLENLTKEARELMCLIYQGKNANTMVAAMVRDQALLVERAFGPQYRQFLSALAEAKAF